VLSLLLVGCAGSQERTQESYGYTTCMTIDQIEELRSVEALLPIAPDSVVERYRRYTPDTFYRTFQPTILQVAQYIDSMNSALDPDVRIDTLAIDHTFEHIGEAARLGGRLYLSSSYFFMFESPAVLRSVVAHEFGHIHYELLSDEQHRELEDVWRRLEQSALFYVFHDGEYSANARFGGHPEESPEELFASAFNLFRNNEEELAARLEYVDRRHHELVRRLRVIALPSAPGEASNRAESPP